MFWDIFYLSERNKEMPKVINVGNKLNTASWSKYELGRFPNVKLGRNCRINTNNILVKDEKLSGYVNDRTMGALDNYANHENIDVYITPLENDLFDDLAIAVYDRSKSSRVMNFPLKLPEGEKNLPEFLRDLYTRIDKGIHPQKEEVKIKVVKPSKLQDIVDYTQAIVQRFNDKRIEAVRNFVEKNQDSNSEVMRTLADAVEYRHYDELYK